MPLLLITWERTLSSGEWLNLRCLDDWEPPPGPNTLDVRQQWVLHAVWGALISLLWNHIQSIIKCLCLPSPAWGRPLEKPRCFRASFSCVVAAQLQLTTTSKYKIAVWGTGEMPQLDRTLAVPTGISITYLKKNTCVTVCPCNPNSMKGRDRRVTGDCWLLSSSRFSERHPPLQLKQMRKKVIEKDTWCFLASPQAH